MMNPSNSNNALLSLAYTDEYLLQKLVLKKTFTLPILYESYDRIIASENKREAKLDKDTGDYNSIYRKEKKAPLKTMKGLGKDMEKLITLCSKVEVMTRLVVAALKKYEYIEPPRLGEVYSRTNPGELFRNYYATTDIIRDLEGLTAVNSQQWSGVNIAAFVLAYYLTHDYDCDDATTDKMFLLADGIENDTFKSRLSILKDRWLTENKKGNANTAKDLDYHFDFEIPTVIAYARWYFQ